MLEVYFPLPGVAENVVELLTESIMPYVDTMVFDSLVKGTIERFILDEEEIILIEDDIEEQIKIRFGNLETGGAFLIIDEPDGKTGFVFDEKNHVAGVRTIWKIFSTFMEALAVGVDTTLLYSIRTHELEFITGMLRILSKASNVEIYISSDEPLVFSAETRLWPRH